MAAKTSWHRYGKIVRHCHPMSVAAPGFCNGGSEVWVYRGSRVRSPPEADTFTVTAVHREFVGFGTV